MPTLRPYQETFISDIRTEFGNGARSVLAVLPTGGGKTFCFSYMASNAEKRGNSVGIVAHRAEILDQIGRALSEFGVNHGYLAPGFPPNPLASVQVCSVQAMARRVDRYLKRPFDFLIVDEAHHAAAGTQWHAIINAHRGKRILGVTATPQRLSGEPLSVAFDQMIIGPSVAELIRLDALSPYRLYAPPGPDMAGIGRRAGDFIRAESEAVMDKPTITGDAVSHYLRLTRGKRALVFCVSVAHAEHVAGEFRAAGIMAASLDGKMDRVTRKKVLADFAAGQVPVLTSCEIVSEGFDVPAIEVAILLRPTESLALYLQQVGRALRPYPGKEYAVILDHAGNSRPKEIGGRGHGFPDDPREWTLGGGKPKHGFGERTIATVVCGRCFAQFRPAPCCPYCGYTRDVKGRSVEFVEGELEEVDPDLVRQAREEEKRAKFVSEKIEERACKNLADWVELAKKRGHEPGWARIRYNLAKNKRKVSA